ncbi:MAG: M3 family oligoendopeptidase [Candidatus Dojkabacteria bacterium]
MKHQFNWNLKALYKDLPDPKIQEDTKKYVDLVNKFSTKWSVDNSFLINPENLEEALNEYNYLIENYAYGGNPGIYLFMQNSLHEDDDNIRGIYNKYIDVLQQCANKMIFFGNRLSKISQEQQNIFLNANNLEKYHSYLRRLFEKSKYILSEPEEKILNLTSKTSYSNWIEMTSTLLSKSTGTIVDNEGNKVVKSFSDISSLMDSKNKKTRESAAKEFNKINKKYSEIATFEMNSVLEIKKVEDELRGHKRADESSILNDDVSTEFIDKLVEGVSNGFNISQRFYVLKAKLLKVDKLKYHERNLSIGEADKTYSESEAVELVNKVLGGIDKSFSEIFLDMVTNGKVDFFPAVGKSGGAYCMPTSKNGPVYVLLNHTNRLQDVLTIAHEMGHAIHYVFAKKQIGMYFGASLATAEVASTFMEDFVLEELIEEADDELKLNIIMMKLNDDVSTIFRQIACYKFEAQLHKEFREKGFLSNAEIGNIFKQNMVAYLGDSVEMEEVNKNWWVYWSHIRRFFYVYSYASGLLISKALQHNFKQDRKYIEKVKEMFAAGESDAPDKIFKSIGIDILKPNFWEQGILEIGNLLNEAEILSKKLGRI